MWNNYWTILGRAAQIRAIAALGIARQRSKVNSAGAFIGTASSGEEGVPEGLIHAGKASCHSWHPSISAHAIWVAGMVAATFPAAISLGSVTKK